MPEHELYISGEDLGAIVGLSKTRISEMTTDGTFHYTEGRGYGVIQAFRDFVRHRHERGDIAAVKKSKLLKEDELLQIAVQKARGEVLPVAEVRQAWADIILKLRDAIRRIGGKVAPMLPYCKSEVEMQRKIEEACDEALSELSKPVDYQTKLE